MELPEYNVDDVLKYIEEEDAKFIRLAFVDAFGIQKNISVMPGELKKAFEEGAPVNAREIAGFRRGQQGTLYLKPDPKTLSVLPWRPDSGKVLRMFCDLYTPAGLVSDTDTRHLLEKAVLEAENDGIRFRFGAESEFYLFKKNEDGLPTKEPYDEAGYMDIAPLDRCENVRREICLTIERMGLAPERSHHEQGPGQNEIDFHFAKPLKAADQMTTFKMVVHTIADKYGLIADFSPMPLSGKPGNGFHINIFAKDKDGQDMAESVAAGILEKIPEMTIFLNPTDNSYERFGINTAPDRINWSSDTGGNLIYLEKGRGLTRLELRSPDASGNPYLVYFLLIRAGLYGIKNRLLLSKEGESTDTLPASRKEAQALAGKSEFISSVLPQEIIDEYTGEL